MEQHQLNKKCKEVCPAVRLSKSGTAAGSLSGISKAVEIPLFVRPRMKVGARLRGNERGFVQRPFAAQLVSI